MTKGIMILIKATCAVCIISLIMVIDVEAKDIVVKKTGIFSSLVYNEEGGDLLGLELFVIYSRDGYYVIFQSAEGEPDAPILVPATIDGNKIAFKVPSSNVGYNGEFRGKIFKDYIIGRFDTHDESFKIPRKKSYWQ